MRTVRIGMRWWLAAIFAVIAVLTALLIAVVSSRQAERDLRQNAESIAVGGTVAAAFAVERSLEHGTMKHELTAIGGQHGLALFVFSSDRKLIAQSGLRSIAWEDVPERNTGLTRALRGRRFVESFRGGLTTVVALPLRRTPKAAALVAYAPRPPAYGAANSIFHTEVVQASVWAVLAAAAAGLLAAWLIARRLRGIATAATAIEQGDFALELRPRFRDEIGMLAVTIDGMRLRLGDAFAQLSAERDRLRLLLEQLQEGVLAIDRQLHVQFANATARELLDGVSLEEDTPLPETFNGLPLHRITEALFVPGAPVAEARSRAEDGTVISLVGVPASASELVVLVLADMTEQERRRRAEREFVTNASHELRTPVAAISSAVEALQSGAGDAPESRERFVELIGRQATRLTRLTNALLMLARAETHQESLQLEPVELRALLDEVAAASDASNGVPVRVDCPNEVVAIAQRDIVEQVLSNLVGNALKHTSSGEVVLRATEANGKAVIEVSDTGSGIPAPAKDRVFERFYSAGGDGRTGFGLGLAIARESAGAIGGKLTVDSQPGRGTTARVVFPKGEG